MMGERMEGQVAIVTGGSRGIGLAIGKALAAEGVAVALVARSHEVVEEAAETIRAGGSRAIGLAADVTDQRAVASIVAETIQQLGPVDLLVNNAGSANTLGPIWEVDPDTWWRDVTTNLQGTFLCAHAVLPGMLARHRGKILNVVSTFGMHTSPQSTPSPYASAYSSSKPAVIVFTANLAAMARDHGVQVFGLRPGFVRTTLLEEGARSRAGRQWLPEIQAILDSDRLVPPEHAARWAVFLASGDADKLSGRVFSVAYEIDTLMKRADDIRREGRYILRLCE
jgi:NAD(P)-dependent dehydrogenase (short-subunit alcohol dehydrogenase family)